MSNDNDDSPASKALRNIRRYQDLIGDKAPDDPAAATQAGIDDIEAGDTHTQEEMEDWSEPFTGSGDLLVDLGIPEPALTRRKWDLCRVIAMAVEDMNLFDMRVATIARIQTSEARDILHGRVRNVDIAEIRRVAGALAGWEPDRRVDRLLPDLGAIRENLWAAIEESERDDE